MSYKKNKVIKLKNRIFIHPDNWIILNPEDAKSSNEVILITGYDMVAVYYSNTPACDISAEEEKAIFTLTNDKGLQGDMLMIFGAIPESFTGSQINDSYSLKEKEGDNND